MAEIVVVVEDDRSIAELVARNLEASGYECHQVHEGDLALGVILQHDPDLVILDIMLPGLDGLEVLRRIRARRDTPVLMLTARAEESDMILGLELGADDYLTKPFSPRELVARARALLRRSRPGSMREMLEFGPLVIDGARRELLRDGARIELTSLEFDLLHFLASRPGIVFSRVALMEQVWGEDRVVDERSIDSLVSRLRRKLEADAQAPRYLQTVWGAGYRFAGEGD
ncbi:DNA-binding response regulator [bacterium]|nr:MAG: DNA-binding response regulator [bacterium]RKZ17582.1 MAG: DNA-binding response regulator [bacterium]